MAKNDASDEVGRGVPANPPRENLVRATDSIGVTRAEGAQMPTLTGHFAVWNIWTEIRSAYEGNFMERFDPSSMTKTLSEHRPKVMFNHGKDPSIGEKLLGTPLRVEPDQEGAFYAVPLFDTAYNRELIPALDAGEYGASFRFSVIREDVVQRPPRSEWNPRGIPERTVQEARVMEFGPVSYPQYVEATAGLRSMTDEYIISTLARDTDLSARTGISLAGIRLPFADRVDAGDICCLTQMVNLGAYYLADQDEASDASDISAMSGVLKTLTTLIQGEIDETDTAPEVVVVNTFYSAKPDGDERDDQALEPDASERTTPPEPEPSEATTHSDRGLFWLADTPTHLKRSK